MARPLYIPAGAVPADGQWHHVGIACTFNPAPTKVWIDGVLYVPDEGD